jgi:hypothetical protein
MKDDDYAKVTPLQYQMLAARRQNHDSMLWQTPVISLTAQAFLFTIALGGPTRAARVIAASLALATALASIQLLAKHRHFEVHYSELLRSVEENQSIPIIHDKPPPGHGMAELSSYDVWQGVFWLFAGAALIAIVIAL